MRMQSGAITSSKTQFRPQCPRICRTQRPKNDAHYTRGNGLVETQAELGAQDPQR